jgi:hypothetical protein
MAPTAPGRDSHGSWTDDANGSLRDFQWARIINGVRSCLAITTLAHWWHSDHENVG